MDGFGPGGTNLMKLNAILPGRAHACWNYLKGCLALRRDGLWLAMSGSGATIGLQRTTTIMPHLIIPMDLIVASIRGARRLVVSGTTEYV